MCDHRVTRRVLFTRDRENRRRATIARDYTDVMEIRRAQYGAAVRLAIVFSVVAAMATVALDVVGDVSTARLVVAVAAIGFATSWVQTGRIVREAEAGRLRRVTVTTVRQPIS